MSPPDTDRLDDEDIARALGAFVRNATADDVTIAFGAGVATLSGAVSSAVARRAIEDLVMAHDGVQSVTNKLVVVSAGVRQQT